jgi:hypothetical protein
LRAEKPNGSLWNVVSFEFQCVFAAIVVKHTPTNHAFAGNCIDTREITNLGVTGGVRNEVVTAWADAARCTCVHNERWCVGDGPRGECRFKEDWK